MSKEAKRTNKNKKASFKVSICFNWNIIYNLEIKLKIAAFLFLKSNLQSYNRKNYRPYFLTCF